MATLTRNTIQSLAVLRAVSAWSRGTYGPLRLHKTLFFADKANIKGWRLFTFKKWYLGQYSDHISNSLNNLQRAGRIRSKYDGPSERIIATLSADAMRTIVRFFDDYFSDWSNAFNSAFRKWAYLQNDDIIRQAHDDPTYKKTERGDEIFGCDLPELVRFEGLPDNVGENLTDLVDGRLQSELSSRLDSAAEKRIVAENWRKVFFNGDD